MARAGSVLLLLAALAALAVLNTANAGKTAVLYLTTAGLHWVSVLRQRPKAFDMLTILSATECALGSRKGLTKFKPCSVRLLLSGSVEGRAELNLFFDAESPVSVDVDSTNEGNYLISLRSAQTGSPVSDKGRKLLQSLFGSITQGVSSQSYGTIGATGSSGNIDQTTKSKANGKISIEYSSSSSDDSGN